ncbi:hypothetical protein M2305_002047 [Gluconobacter cerinus]|uniref:hypothetical protein n=1 Tax=Gluconobacter cerinus TaxID=38307 RepID=UPI0022265817|nr:hypothetical protein [Gluconobacter cerinus]MCW2266100.1 hypothetical protein [Gluconobacter cerinus]
MSLRSGFISAAIIASLACSVPHATAHAPSGQLSRLSLLPLHDGLNTFESPLGPFSIFQAWRDNGNAWGYHMYVLTTVIDKRTSVIGIEGSSETPDRSFEDHLRDSPHTGEDALTTIQFAHGELNGKPATLLFEAIRNPKDGPVTSRGPTIVYIYSLVASDGAPGWTPLYFRFFKKIAVPGTFCSSDIALKVATGLPLSADAGPPSSPDGCFP